ncbi:Alpha-ketoglutarate-dependent taurine dioxygenase [Actinomadura rubteroloni]|uniref:Alpha-ketoglutarate-dependent taurine dioxygenase n=1 Tax=Actinomadura rubteroloni TaxID=1926885 RepID=A0A2P4UQM2_9ACTN|nr:TauD/TfdA family dioxygenase [Actinomadura rubteroloni]POM27351.1 Alpha-ketoglutarate-dependent taurine dioxygenase [Actinomadura rubteroloni]
MTVRHLNYQVHRADPRFGVEISGPDLTRPVDDAAADALHHDFIGHRALVRDQHLNPHQHVTAMRIIGDPFDHLTARPAATRVLLPFLLDCASSPDYSIRFGWRRGDFVPWDDQATWHYAIGDYANEPRRHRMVIATRKSFARCA